EAALARTPPESTDLPGRLGNLAIRLSTRYDLRGDPADLDRAVALQEEAVALTPAGSTSYPRRIGNLASRLSDRFDLRGDPTDLDRAVALQEEAVALTPASSIDRPLRLNRLSLRLSDRFDLRGDPADFDRAVALQEEAVALTPASSTSRPMRLHNLANRLSDRFDLRGDPADLDRAVALQEEAVQSSAPGSPGHARRSLRLAALLADRHDQTATPEDLHRAVRLARSGWGYQRGETGLETVHAAGNVARILRKLRATSAEDTTSEEVEVLGVGVASLDGILGRASLTDDALANTVLDRHGQLHEELVSALSILATRAASKGSPESARDFAAQAYRAIARAKGRQLSARMNAGALRPSHEASGLITQLEALEREIDRVQRSLARLDENDAVQDGQDEPDQVHGTSDPDVIDGNQLLRSNLRGKRLLGEARASRNRGSKSQSVVRKNLPALQRAAYGQRLWQLEAKATQVLRDIQSMDPRWATATGTVSPPSVEEVAAALPSGGIALVLFPTTDATAVITVNGHSNPNLQPTEVDLTTMPRSRGDTVRRVRRAIAGVNDGDDEALLRLLYEFGIALGPIIFRVIGHMQLRRVMPSLVIMPTGSLHRFPFHAVPWMADGESWDGTTCLADVARISYAATPDVLVLRAREATRDQDSGRSFRESHGTVQAMPTNPRAMIAAVAPGIADVPGGHAPDLTVALTLATAQLVPNASRVRVATRAAASRRSVIGESALAGADLALVATHGRAGEVTGGHRSGLLMHADRSDELDEGTKQTRYLGDTRADATWLTAREMLARLPLDGTRHVQLLACETHADSPAPGDELAGLVSTFLIRGAASVAGTLWPV
ncbi:MAG: CHAT domain-containing protein, partial [Chloroflexi bacterium]|nr:CHAT domain-containing protein [Chloroflexota bacterium]